MVGLQVVRGGTGWARLSSEIPALSYDRWRHLDVWLWCLSSAYLLLLLKAFRQSSVQPGVAWSMAVYTSFWKPPQWSMLPQDALLDACTSLVLPQLSWDTGAACCPSSVPSSYFQEIIVTLGVLRLGQGTPTTRLWLKHLLIAGSWVNIPIWDKQAGIYCSKWFL